MEDFTSTATSMGVKECLTAIAREHGVLRSLDLADASILLATLARVARSGRLMRSGLGLYYQPDADGTEKHSLAEIG